jgi:hypothetical protein
MKKILLIGLCIVSCDAQAYLDGGTGSMLLQLLLGGIAGAGVILKLYWYKLLALFNSKSQNKK